MVNHFRRGQGPVLCSTKEGLQGPGEYAVARLVEALCYKTEGRGFDSRWGHWHFLLNPFGRTMALGSTQSLTQMSNGRGGFLGPEELKLNSADSCQ